MTTRLLAIALFILPQLALAEARKVDDFQWEGVERIVAIGDIHGDYDNYIATLSAAGTLKRRLSQTEFLALLEGMDMVIKRQRKRY